ncbi:MAG: Radical domain protein [Firmicutes bacterium]|nr:Radical domain protein [Bacillota bacterium]
MIKFTELKETSRKVLRDVIPLAKPFTLLIEPSSLCNFRCKMCFQSAKEQGEFKNKRSNMTIECFEKIVEQVKAWQGDKFKVLKLCIYGEPFINSAFSKMLHIAKETNIAERIETTSNASLLTEDLCRELVLYGLDYLRVSIYSAIPEKHAEITHSNIPMQKIYDNLEMLKRIKKEMKSDKPFVAVKMLDTYSDENQVFQKMYQSVADEIYLDQPHNWVQPSKEGFIDKLYDEVPTLQKSKRIACTMPFTTLAVRSNGDVAPCCIDWYGGTNIGNIYNRTLSEIWNGENLYQMRVLQLTDRKKENISCRNCEFYKSNYYTRDNIDGFPVEKLRDSSMNL